MELVQLVGSVIMNVLGTIWMETVLSYKALSQNLRGGTEVNHDKF